MQLLFFLFFVPSSHHLSDTLACNRLLGVLVSLIETFSMLHSFCTKMSDFETLPATIITHISRFTETNDLLQLRVSSKIFFSFLTGEESEAIWRDALLKDFAFEDGVAVSSGSGINSNNDNNHLQTLKIHPQRNALQNQDSTEAQSESPTSIFGYGLSEADSLFIASCSFESWKHWSKASRIFHRIDDNQHDDSDADMNKESQLETRYKLSYINGPFFLRAAKLWSDIEQWCKSDESGAFGNAMLATLEPGVPREKGRFSQIIHSKEATHAFEAVFAFCGGQASLEPLMGSSEFREKSMLGMFGGYKVYDHFQCTMLCSAQDAYRMEIPDHSIISGNFLSRRFRYIAVNVKTGKLNVLSVHNGRTYAFRACKNENGRYDDGLLWMEEYARRLRNRELGLGSVEVFGPLSQQVLSPFPSGQSPLASRKVTQGIEVVASSVGAIEIMTVVYSIRIRILTEQEDGYMKPDERGFETCQLSTRHWRLIDSNSDGGPDIVNGEGVVGLLPLLKEGGYRDDHVGRSGDVVRGTEENGTFVYQSCASIESGTFEGRIKFIPGSINQPTGDPFFVEVGRFALELESDITF